MGKDLPGIKVVCNKAAGLSQCLTNVHESMVTQLKVLHGDKSKDKSCSKTQQAVDELDYFVTFNRGIAQANAGLVRRYIHQHGQSDSPPGQLLRLSKSRNRTEYPQCCVQLLLHMCSFFPDHFLAKAEEEI